jgi:murein DD-endopeptidase MepM/ murein hydrolase activator NlpD
VLPIKNADETYWLSRGITQVWANPSIGYPNNKHNGVDFGTMVGTSIVAAWKGKVVKSDYDKGYGRHVRILHPTGELSIYGHFKTLAVSEGQDVLEGDYLGESGGNIEDAMRGQSTGPHLHFEVRSNPYVATSNIDPLAWLVKVKELSMPMDPLFGKVKVIATPWVRVRTTPSLKGKIIGNISTGEILEVAPVPTIIADGLEWVPLVYYTARGPREDQWLKQE